MLYQVRAPRLAKAALLTISIVLCLATLEIGLRIHTANVNRMTFAAVFDGDAIPPQFRGDELRLAAMIRPVQNPRIIYELRPDLSGFFQAKRLTTSSEGFRCRSYPQEKPAGTRRIVGIGDSFMFGNGVGDDDIYMVKLERLLEKSTDQGHWQVINTAVPGYNTVMEVETLMTTGLAYQPDYVIIEFVANDLSLPNFIRTTTSPVAPRSFLLDLLRQRAGSGRGDPLLDLLDKGGLEHASRSDTAMYFEIDPEAVPAEYRDMVGWNAFETAMAELEGLRKRHGFEVIQLSLAPGESRLKKRALAIGRKLGFHVLDVGPALRSYMSENGIENYLGSKLAVGKTNGHPSAIAHSIAAQQLFALLAEIGARRSS